jgi:hypothetical protein
MHHVIPAEEPVNAPMLFPTIADVKPLSSELFASVCKPFSKNPAKVWETHGLDGTEMNFACEGEPPIDLFDS